MVVNINTDEFNSKILITNNKPILVIFSAKWSLPSFILNSIISKIEGDYTIYNIDIDSNKELANKYEVSLIPTSIIFYNGSIIKQFVGVQDLSLYLNLLNNCNAK